MRQQDISLDNERQEPLLTKGCIGEPYTVVKGKLLDRRKCDLKGSTTERDKGS